MSANDSGLNLAQLDAVNHLGGPSLVLAGAGSGKTRVITHKIGRLIQAGLEAERIAAITFTNKAASEMRERAKQLVGRDARKVLICTFHSLGVRLLREDGAALGLKKQFSILDTDDITSLLKDCGGSTDTAAARQWQWAISAWKSAGLNAEQALALAKDDDERVTATIMARYEERLSAYQSVDFDDLISLPLKLLSEHPDVRERWQKKMGHVLVDEYQDTNATQYELLKLLVGARARASTAGAVPRWTTSSACRKTFRNCASSNWSKTTAPPAPFCGPPTTSSAPTPSCSPKRCGATWARATPCGW
jgi:ATP-dependent DNA helicase Rep